MVEAKCRYLLLLHRHRIKTNDFLDRAVCDSLRRWIRKYAVDYSRVYCDSRIGPYKPPSN
eukprot:SAG31_NODE_26642_length_439_cov_0.523529_1_plen_59_part_01